MDSTLIIFGSLLSLCIVSTVLLRGIYFLYKRLHLRSDQIAYDKYLNYYDHLNACDNISNICSRRVYNLISQSRHSTFNYISIDNTITISTHVCYQLNRNKLPFLHCYCANNKINLKQFIDSMISKNVENICVNILETDSVDIDVMNNFIPQILQKLNASEYHILFNDFTFSRVNVRQNNNYQEI